MLNDLNLHVLPSEHDDNDDADEIFQDSIHHQQRRLARPYPIPEADVVMICDPFFGPEFERLVHNRITVLGPQYLMYMVRSEKPLFPRGVRPEHPIYSAAFTGVVCCCTQFENAARGHLRTLIQYMNGEFNPALTSKVTHVVCAPSVTRSEKYQVAVQLGMPIMSAEWVEETWRRCALKHFLATEQPDLVALRLPTFTNCVIALTGFSAQSRSTIQELTVAHGGVYSPHVQSSTTHLLVPANHGLVRSASALYPAPLNYPFLEDGDQANALESEKARLALQPSAHMVKIVSVEWFADSIAGHVCMSEASYVPARVQQMRAQGLDSPRLMDLHAEETVMEAPVQCNPSLWLESDTERAVANKTLHDSFLDGCIVFFWFDEASPRTNLLRRLLLAAGGRRFNDITDATTHILLGKAPSNDLREFIARHDAGRRVQVVGALWLASCIAASSWLPEDDFCIDLHAVDRPAPTAVAPKLPQPAMLPSVSRPGTAGQGLSRASSFADSGMPLQRASSVSFLQTAAQQQAVANVTDLANMFMTAGARRPSVVAEVRPAAVVATAAVVTTAPPPPPPRAHVRAHAVPSAADAFLPLKDMTICISMFENPRDRNALRDQVSRLGGLFTERFSRKSDVLVCGSPQGSKFETAGAWGVVTVSRAWLDSCEDSGTRVPFEHFPIAPPPAVASVTSGNPTAEWVNGAADAALHQLDDGRGIAAAPTVTVLSQESASQRYAPLVVSTATSSRATASIQPVAAARKSARRGRSAAANSTQVPAAQELNIISLTSKPTTALPPKPEPVEVDAPLAAEASEHTPQQPVTPGSGSGSAVDSLLVAKAFEKLAAASTMPKMNTRLRARRLLSTTSRSTTAVEAANNSAVAPAAGADDEMSLDDDGLSNGQHSNDGAVANGPSGPTTFQAAFQARRATSTSPGIANAAVGYTRTFSNAHDRSVISPTSALAAGAADRDGVAPPALRLSRADSAAHATSVSVIHASRRAGSAAVGVGVPGAGNGGGYDAYSQEESVTYDNPESRAQRENMREQLRQSIAGTAVPSAGTDLANLPANAALNRGGGPASKSTATAVARGGGRSAIAPNDAHAETTRQSLHQLQYHTPGDSAQDSGQFDSSRNKPRMFLLSAIAEDEKVALAGVIESLGGKVLVTAYYSTACTHLVVSTLGRSEKYMAALAAGRWILKPSYISASRDAGHFVREEDHEWVPESNTHHSHQVLLEPCRRWRLFLERKPELTGAFHGWRVMLCVDQERQHGFQRLLEAGGARVTFGSAARIAQANSQALAEPAAPLLFTHAFVDITQHHFGAHNFDALAKSGTECLKPEYIADFLVQNPPPAPDRFRIFQSGSSGVSDGSAEGSRRKRTAAAAQLGGADSTSPRTRARR
ncbi:hypothetical protein CAOG_01652 [Capsaspora owczarzaki ATCC 30864]|nr:hypothetical protein CAOG_01652 [Capsaspora owczarzaki ATCC 30864]|eukprot:XP_004364520.2 hypothetical protein CAOG_01652 [Capsaspora owczarzaki ATCC 30864]